MLNASLQELSYRTIRSVRVTIRLGANPGLCCRSHSRRYPGCFWAGVELLATGRCGGIVSAIVVGSGVADPGVVRKNRVRCS